MVTGEVQDRAVAQALKANLPDLLRYLLRRANGPEEAADLLSDTAVVIWSKRAKAPEGAEPLRMWMFVIARYSLRAHWRSEKRRSAATAALAGEIRRAVDVEVASSVDDRLDVRAALARLPKRLREPLVLVHWDGFTLEGAAEHLGVNASTLRSRYAAARVAVAKELRISLEEASGSPIQS